VPRQEEAEKLQHHLGLFGILVVATQELASSLHDHSQQANDYVSLLGNS